MCGEQSDDPVADGAQRGRDGDLHGDAEHQQPRPVPQHHADSGPLGVLETDEREHLQRGEAGGRRASDRPS